MTFTDNEERRQKELSTAQRQLHDPQDSFSKAKTEDAAEGKSRSKSGSKGQDAESTRSSHLFVGQVVSTRLGLSGETDIEVLQAGIKELDGELMKLEDAVNEAREDHEVKVKRLDRRLDVTLYN